MDKTTSDEVLSKIHLLGDMGLNWNSDSNNLKFAKAMVDTLMNNFNNCDEIYNSRSIDDSVGLELDNIGDDLGQPRYGRSDDDYKFVLKTKIIASHSSGTTNDIINIIADALEVDPKTNNIQVKDSYHWDGTEMVGDPYVVELSDLPMSIITSSAQLATLMDRINSAAVAGVIIKAVNFINSSTMIEYAGQSVWHSITKLISVSGGK